MLDQKDTDFDDLLRRASDKYPLRTDSADWDRMAAALDNDPPPDGTNSIDNDRRRRRRFLWLLLLLPIGGMSYFMLHRSGSAASQEAGTAVVRPTTTTGSTPAATGSTTTTGSATTTESTTAAGSNGTAGTAGDAAAPGAKADGGVSTITGADQAANRKHAAGAGKSAGVTGDSSDNATRTGVTGGANTFGKRTLSKRNKNKTTQQPGQSGNGSEEDAVAAGAGNSNSSISNGISMTTTAAAPGDQRLAATGFTLKTVPTGGDYRLLVDVKAPEKKKDSTKGKPKASEKKKSSFLYAGIVVAPDLSTVKMQSVKGVGDTYGILLGYQLNKHWAIESGVYLDRKRYYTDGEYFNTKNVNLSSNYYLNNVDGTCYMWEIPLNVRYNFNPEGKLKWFATAGLSTYLMTKENYAYNYSWGGTWPGDSTSTWNIKKPSQYPFSIMSLSAGFETPLGRIGNLRIEPYVRIPLGGIGTGKLPIMSTGINIGITRRLW